MTRGVTFSRDRQVLQAFSGGDRGIVRQVGKHTSVDTTSRDRSIGLHRDLHLHTDYLIEGVQLGEGHILGDV